MPTEPMRKPRSICLECPALVEGLCGALCEDELTRLSAGAWHRRFQAGQVVHAEGEIPPSFCAVLSGVVKLMKSLPNGSQQIVGLLLPGDFLGRPFGRESNASAVAATDVKLCWFPRSAVEALATGSDPVKRWFYERVADDLEKAQDWIMLLGRMSAEQRIAAFLLSVARRAQTRDATRDAPRDGARDGETAPLLAETFIEVPISRTEMADYLGLTIETVSRQIARLRERGVLTVGASRTMVIHRPDVLEATVESAPVSERAKDAVRA
jgi:CRP/FNR family transcriptional regulator, anaerobic regulatory protein